MPSCPLIVRACLPYLLLVACSSDPGPGVDAAPPSDAHEGVVELGTNLDIAVLDQKREDLNPEDTLAHYLTDGRGENLLVNGEQKHVTGYMKDFLFAPEQARTPIRNLSGGEPD